MRNVELTGGSILAGPEIEVGQKAPDFTVQKNDMSDYTLASGAGRTRIFLTLLSLATPVCDTETRRFSEKATGAENVEIVAISADLPMTQTSWCGAAGIENVITASDHRNVSFGRAYGCVVEGGALDRCLWRAVFVVGPDDVLKHVEYVPELGREPDYAAALAAARG